MELLNKTVNRLFTFGCSFTGYIWPTWADVLAYELKVPFYNYGRSGAGNQYMFSQLMNADNHFSFNENDLIIIAWTNFAREDRYANGCWHTPGNIFSQDTYDKKFVREWADYNHFCIRDLAAIKAAITFLEFKKVKRHHFKMLDFQIIDQWANDKNQTPSTIFDSYKATTDKIHRSFYDVLWAGDLQAKMASDQNTIGENFFDGHPFPIEHLKYLETIFPSQFSNDTINQVSTANSRLMEALIQDYNPKQRGFLSSRRIPSEIWFSKPWAQPLAGII